MELELHIRGTGLLGALRKYTERCFRFPLRRLGHCVKRLRVSVEDLNAPVAVPTSVVGLLHKYPPPEGLLLRRPTFKSTRP